MMKNIEGKRFLINKIKDIEALATIKEELNKWAQISDYDGNAVAAACEAARLHSFAEKLINRTKPNKQI